MSCYALILPVGTVHIARTRKLPHIIKEGYIVTMFQFVACYVTFYEKYLRKYMIYLCTKLFCRNEM
jgi:hypothetical protein